MTQSHSFPKSLRLLNAQDYSRVFSDVDLRVSSSHFLILSKPLDNIKPRLGIIVAKKHVKLAVNRNKIKRQLRETFRSKQHTLPPLDLVVLAKKGAGDLDREAIRKELDFLWRKLKQKAKS